MVVLRVLYILFLCWLCIVLAQANGITDRHHIEAVRATCNWEKKTG